MKAVPRSRSCWPQPTHITRMLGMCLLSHWMVSVWAGDLPPPPRSAAAVTQYYTLYLDLVLNQYAVGKTIPTIVKQDHYHLQKATLEELGIRLPEQAHATTLLSDQDVLVLGYASRGSDWVDVSQLAGVDVRYDALNQRLQLDLPPAWLPTQVLGKDTWYVSTPAQSTIGLLSNYDYYGHHSAHGDETHSLFSEQRLFSPYGALNNTGMYSHYQQQAKGSAHNGYRRYETTFQYDHESSATSLFVGDIVSATKNTWGSSVRMGGIQIQRNFQVRPDLVTYPLPQFSGQAALPSSIDLLINGHKASSTEVQAGPFVLNNLPYINGRGEAVIVTTDALGRQVSTSVPFYVASSLLKPKLWDYSLAVGKIRADYGQKDFSYGDWAAAADMRYGVTPWLTAEARGEWADDLQLYGAGAVLKLHPLGVVAASVSHSRNSAGDDHNKRPVNPSNQGNQYTVSYQYNQNRFGFNLNHTRRDEAYTDLSRLSLSDLISVNSQRSTTANAYFATPQQGTFGIGYVQTQVAQEPNKLLNLSWSPTLPAKLQGATVSLSANHDLVDHQWTAAVQVSIPLFQQKSSLNYAFNKTDNGHSQYVNYNRPVPNGGGIGYDLSRQINHAAADNQQAQLQYRNTYFNAQAGVSGNHDYNRWLGVSGALVWMPQGVFAANRLGESFALIDTHQVGGIPVSYENSLIGTTNRSGHVFVPSVTPYFSGKYAINPLDLPSNYITTQVEQRSAVKRGSGMVVSFPVKKSWSANVTLRLNNGDVVPVGAMVHRQGHDSSYVGMDGIAFIEDLQADNRIRVSLPEQRLCEATFAIDTAAAENNILTINPVVCLEVKLP